MHRSIKSTLVLGCFGIALAALAACTPRRIPPMSVTDLMEDRVTLDGVLMKCNRDPVQARGDVNCANARLAVERLASRNEVADQAKRSADFERSRETRRVEQDRQREAQQQKTKVDAYHLPLVPVDSPPPPKDPQSPIVGQTSP